MSEHAMSFGLKTHLIVCSLGAVLAISMPGGPVCAQTDAAGQAPNAGTSDAARAATGSSMPNDYRLNLMIRTTIVALNQANQTGNYTVLRDLGSPNFQLANTAARLSEAFAALRASGFDLSPVLFFEPKLLRKPEIRDNGLLLLTGFFPTQPQQVNFDLAFQKVNQDWRLFGIALTTSPAAGTASDPAANVAPENKVANEAAKSSAPAGKAGAKPAPKR
jgi:hypothetical protein